jgi:hypothetical protein
MKPKKQKIIHQSLIITPVINNNIIHDIDVIFNNLFNSYLTYLINRLTRSLESISAAKLYLPLLLLPNSGVGQTNNGNLKQDRRQQEEKSRIGRLPKISIQLNKICLLQLLSTKFVCWIGFVTPALTFLLFVLFIIVPNTSDYNLHCIGSIK